MQQLPPPSRAHHGGVEPVGEIGGGRRAAVAAESGCQDGQLDGGGHRRWTCRLPCLSGSRGERRRDQAEEIRCRLAGRARPQSSAGPGRDFAPSPTSVICFAAWTIFSIIAVQIKKNLGLNDTQFGLLVGTPILTGRACRP
jgi:hypothetical protein